MYPEKTMPPYRKYRNGKNFTNALVRKITDILIPKHPGIRAQVASDLFPVNGFVVRVGALSENPKRVS